ncbi:MAG: potassium channel family protein [Candidatus Omnitrophica bacterium]|nr:potassium channel family protein [Candidatus Omnitrophota bacterium]
MMFGKIFVNPLFWSDKKVESAYERQFRYLKAVWNDDSYGLERLLRIFLCGIQFVYPVLFIRDIFGRKGVTARKLAVEAYVVLKLFFPLIVLWTGAYRFPWVIALIVYLLTETTFHILNLIFLSDIHSVSVSYHRSVLLLFLHYIETAMDFAAIYIAFDLLNVPLNWVSAVYFSMVANTTVGFGDIHARGTAGQAVVIVQLLICVLFVILFINYFSQKINTSEE